MDRRRLLAGAGAAAVARPGWADDLPVPAGDQIAFKVLHNGSPVGEHRLRFTRNGGALDIEITVTAAGYVAGLIPFTYTAQVTERWLNGVFQSVDSHVNDNGNLLQVHAHKTDKGYDVVSSNRDHPEKCLPEYTAPPNTMPLSYWNKAMLNGIILNFQTGHCYPAIVHSPGWDNLPDANGGTILAQRFDVTGKLHLSVWYDQANQWSGLDLPLFGHLTYEKIL